MWDNRQAEIFLNKAAALGCVPGLDGMRRLMELLGNAQDELPVIHIAGTNGKGSTGAMLEAVLREAGFLVGRYSSPAVFCPEEKYKVDGVDISPEEYIDLLEPIAAACSRMEEEGKTHPTIFEVETAAAFLWFYRRKCEIVILETGMGGELDATNIIEKPVLSVLTPISMDHMGFLGDSLAKIAEAKAGIIKEGVPAVTAKQCPEVYEVLERACMEQHTMLLRSSEPRNLHYLLGDVHIPAKLEFDVEGLSGLRLSLLGSYQPENAACVVRAVGCLRTQGYDITEEMLRQGLGNACWPGRFEVLCSSPLVVLDGAHNEAAAKKLRHTLEMGFTNRRIIYIIGVLADKEHEKMLKIMLPFAYKVYTVTPDNPRALPGEDLCREAKQYHGRVAAASVAEAVHLALADTKEDPKAMILAFGSLSWLGEMKKEMENRGYHDR